LSPRKIQKKTAGPKISLKPSRLVAPFNLRRTLLHRSPKRGGNMQEV
jgi:hypothetical protein